MVISVIPSIFTFPTKFASPVSSKLSPAITLFPATVVPLTCTAVKLPLITTATSADPKSFAFIINELAVILSDTSNLLFIVVYPLSVVLPATVNAPLIDKLLPIDKAPTTSKLFKVAFPDVDIVEKLLLPLTANPPLIEALPNIFAPLATFNSFNVANPDVVKVDKLLPPLTVKVPFNVLFPVTDIVPPIVVLPVTAKVFFNVVAPLETNSLFKVVLPVTFKVPPMVLFPVIFRLLKVLLPVTDIVPPIVVLPVTAKVSFNVVAPDTSNISLSIVFSSTLKVLFNKTAPSTVKPAPSERIISPVIVSPALLTAPILDKLYSIFLLPSKLTV